MSGMGWVYIIPKPSSSPPHLPLSTSTSSCICEPSMEEGTPSATTFLCTLEDEVGAGEADGPFVGVPPGWPVCHEI